MIRVSSKCSVVYGTRFGCLRGLISLELSMFLHFKIYRQLSKYNLNIILTFLNNIVSSFPSKIKKKMILKGFAYGQVGMRI